MNISLKTMKSTKADSFSEIEKRIDDLIGDNIRLSNEVVSLRKIILASSCGAIVFDPSKTYCLMPTSVSSSAPMKSSIPAKKDCYDKREGEYNKKER